MLAEVPWKPDQLVDQPEQPLASVALGIQARLAKPPGQGLACIRHIEAVGNGCQPIEREAHRLAHVTDGRPQPIANHLSRHAGPLAAVGFVDVLQHLFATLMLEIDIDIGGLLPLPADKPLEEQRGAGRIDRGDPQAVADGRVGC